MRLEKIKKDITRIDEAIASNNLEEMKKLGFELYQTYWNEIPDLLESLYNDIDKYAEMNLKIIKGKLELMKPIKEDNKLQSESEKPIIQITNINENKNNVSNQNQIEINISFEDVRNQINAMDATLDQDQIDEILQKISELETILKSNEKKSTKWKKASTIGKWLFDKSVDVGIALLPLFLKIGQ